MICGKFGFSAQCAHKIANISDTELQNMRWGFFTIASAGWRISEESFMKQHLPIISNLKLRGSYGEVASNQGFTAFQWIPGFSLSGGGSYEFNNGSLVAGAQSPAIVNPTLTWAVAKTSDIGIDIGLWKNKLTIEFDIYRRNQEGLPATRALSLPNTFGASLPQENLNSNRTDGTDFTVSFNDKELGKSIFLLISTVLQHRNESHLLGSFVDKTDQT